MDFSRHTRNAVLPLALMLGAMLPGLPVHADSLLSLPIMVEADAFEMHLDREHAVWRGNVIAHQGNYTFRAGSLSVSLEQVAATPPQHKGSQSSAPADAAYILSAERVTYDVDSGTISGEGDSEIRRGQERIRADRIIYYVREGRALALPSENGRVFVQFFSNPEAPVFPGNPVAFAGAAD